MHLGRCRGGGYRMARPGVSDVADLFSEALIAGVRGREARSSALGARLLHGSGVDVLAVTDTFVEAAL